VTVRQRWMDALCDEESSHHPRSAPSCHMRLNAVAFPLCLCSHVTVPVRLGDKKSAQPSS
jgi:hypothetical protein